MCAGVPELAYENAAPFKSIPVENFLKLSYRYRKQTINSIIMVNFKVHGGTGTCQGTSTNKSTGKLNVL